MLKDIVVRIGVVGNFYEDNFNFILKSLCKVLFIYRIVYKILICIFFILYCCLYFKY